MTEPQHSSARRRAGSRLTTEDLRNIASVIAIVTAVVTVVSWAIDVLTAWSPGPFGYVVLGSAATALSISVGIFVYVIAYRVRTRATRVGAIGDGRSKQAVAVKVELSQGNVLYVDSEKAFYQHLVEAIRGAESEVFRSGSGFARKRHEDYFKNLLEAEEYFLRKKTVSYLRIQTGSMASSEWADGLARLMDSYRGVSVFEDFRGRQLFDICLVDPLDDVPFILLLREVEERAAGQGGSRYRFGSVIILTGFRDLAKNLRDWFHERAQSGRVMDARTVRQLGERVFYFAYGTHMYSGRMVRDGLAFAEPRRATLRGWRRVTSQLDSGQRAIGLIQDHDAFVEGVVYEVSQVVRAHLDARERDLKATTISMETDRGSVTGFTYAPRDPISQGPVVLAQSDLDDIVKGANENRLSCHEELRRWAEGGPAGPWAL